MFRPMRRKKKEISTEAAKQLLHRERCNNRIKRAQIVGNAGDFRIQKRYAEAWQKGDAWILQIFLRIS